MLHAPFIKHDDRNGTINSRTMHRLLIILSYTRRGKDRRTSRKRPLHGEDVSSCARSPKAKKIKQALKKRHDTADYQKHLLVL